MSFRGLMKGCLAAAALAALAGCGRREASWDAAPEAGREPLATLHAVALLDPPAERVLMLPVEADLSVAPVSIPVGRNIPLPGAGVTADGQRLAVLCRGDIPRRSADEQGPALYVIGGGERPALEAKYELSDPLSGLTLDPASRYAVVSASSGDTSFVANPNELIITDLLAPPSAANPTAITLRSFGGRPERLDFTAPLELPAGRHRLLVAQTDRDVALLDLDDLQRPEITVRLTGGAVRLSPAGLAVSDGEAGRNDDARLAIRMASDPNVVIVDLLPPTDEAAASGAPFRPVPNIVGVGGAATDIAFVRTDGGLRLAALVPGKKALVLVEPQTGTTADLDLGAPFEHIALVSDETGTASSGIDTALLWSSSQGNIAFVALGQTTGKPYKSVEVLPLDRPIWQVLPVPAPFQHRKVLVSTDGSSFYLLDLQARSIAPLTAQNARFLVSPSGRRAWAFRQGSSSLASIDLDSAHPQNFLLPRAILGVADVARRDGGRALVAVHSADAFGLTILDGEAPSLLRTREYSSILLEGLP